MLRPQLLELIRAEADAQDGRIVMKMNSLVDPEMIDALYAASTAGAEIDLIIRGICCLRPGVKGDVETNPRPIDRRPLPRALAHLPLRQRCEGAQYYIGSADLMPRNLDRRVECVAPVVDPALASRLRGDPRDQPGGRRAGVGATAGRLAEGANEGRHQRTRTSAGARADTRARRRRPGVEQRDGRA